MKNLNLMITGLVAALFMLTGAEVMAQGGLSPPGLPGKMMKTLNQVEPRTPIPSLPYMITNAGSYYLTSNLSSTTNGIIIKTSRVTVNMMGFSITGYGVAVGHGIHVFGATNAEIDKVVIKGGTITGFNHGLYCEYMNNSRIEHLVVSDNQGRGIYLDGSSGGGKCNGNTITYCTISRSGYAGVYLNGSAGECNGNTVAYCSISENDDEGVYLYAATGECNGNTVAHCSINDNGEGGVSLYTDSSTGECNGNTIAHCSINDNSDDGVVLYADDAEQCHGNRVQGNQISKNTDNGLRIRATGTRVEANHVSGTTGSTTYGIKTYSSPGGNLILKNTCIGQDNNFSLNTNDTYGMIVTNSGVLAGTDPWANFSIP